MNGSRRTVIARKALLFGVNKDVRAGAFWARTRLGRRVVFRDLARVDNFTHALSIPVVQHWGKMIPTKVSRQSCLCVPALKGCYERKKSRIAPNGE